VGYGRTLKCCLAGYRRLTSSFRRCVAVGSYESENGQLQTLLEENLGTGWNLVPSPSSGTNQDNALSSVACAGPSFCVAVGSSGSYGHDLPLIEQTTGSGWTLTPRQGSAACLESRVQESTSASPRAGISREVPAFSVGRRSQRAL
jgi:hypothetical protein